MVSIPSTFDIGKSKSPDGVDIEINPDAVTGGVIRQAQHMLYRRIGSDIHLYLIVHRNHSFARLFLDLLELKVSFAMRFMHCIQMLDLCC